MRLYEHVLGVHNTCFQEKANVLMCEVEESEYYAVYGERVPK